MVGLVGGLKAAAALMIAFVNLLRDRYLIRAGEDKANLKVSRENDEARKEKRRIHDKLKSDPSYAERLRDKYTRR